MTNSNDCIVVADRGQQIRPPATFFLYFMFQDKDVVRNGINNGGLKPFDQPTLTDEEEEQEDEDDNLGGDPIAVIMRRNRRVGDGPRISRIRFSQDTSEETFRTVVQRNEKLLNAVKRQTAVKKEPAKIQSTSNALIRARFANGYDDDDDDFEALDQYNDALALIGNLSKTDNPTTETDGIGKYRLVYYFFTLLITTSTTLFHLAAAAPPQIAQYKIQ